MFIMLIIYRFYVFFFKVIIEIIENLELCVFEYILCNLKLFWLVFFFISMKLFFVFLSVVCFCYGFYILLCEFGDLGFLGCDVY